ncbi:MAG: maleylpyruvate isomerase N-terminal domain-containing protein [Acidimicrobiales bacterium]
MLLTPRYDAPPIIAVEPRLAGPHPVVQQRRRLEALLDGLRDDEWRQPSRCDAWSVQDVITHLVSTNRFWALSITQALAGEPTRFLASFDPVASPAQLVDTTRGTPPADTLAAFRASNAEMLDAIEALDDNGWDSVGEAPPGHVPVWLVADHALWDCWVHERDIVLPLGRPPVEDAHEIITCLRYAAGLGQAFEVSSGGGIGGTAVLEVTDPDARIVVSATAEQVRVHDGDAPAGAHEARLAAVPALEMLSRREAGEPVPDAIAWLAAGVAVVFDQDDVEPDEVSEPV